LIVQETKTTHSCCDPEPQLIAEAIAAYQVNNETNAALGQPTLNIMSIPGITMIGTWPMFYLVQVMLGLQ
jgi:hypothetical protein